MEEVTHSNKGGRIPPQDIVAEKSLLGAILISENAIAEAVNIVRPTDFYEPSHQTIYQAMMNLYDQHRPIDLSTLTSDLKSIKGRWWCTVFNGAVGIYTSGIPR